MRVKVLGAFGSEGQGQRPSAFLVDDHVLVDAGTVGGALTVPEQIAIDPRRASATPISTTSSASAT